MAATTGLEDRLGLMALAASSSRPQAGPFGREGRPLEVRANYYKVLSGV